MRILNQVRHAYQLTNLTYQQRKTLSYASVALCRPQLPTRYFASTMSDNTKYVKSKKIQKRYRRNLSKPIYGSMFKRRSSRSISSITPVAVISRDDKIQKIALIPIKLFKGKNSNREALQAAMDIFAILRENGHDVDLLLDQCEIEAPMVAGCGPKSESSGAFCKKSTTTTKSETDQMKNPCETSSIFSSSATETQEQHRSQEKKAEQKTTPKYGGSPKSIRNLCSSSNASSATDSKVQYGSQEKAPEQKAATISECGSSPQSAEKKVATEPKPNRDLCRTCGSKTSVDPSRKPSTTSKCGTKHDSVSDSGKEPQSIPKSDLASKSKPSPCKNLLKCGSRPRFRSEDCSKIREPTAQLPSKTSKSELNKDRCKKSLAMTKSSSISESRPDPCKKSSTDSKAECGSQMETPKTKVKDSSTSESNKEPCGRLSISPKTEHKFESKLSPCQKSEISPGSGPKDDKVPECGSYFKSKQTTPPTPELSSKFESKNQEQNMEGKPRTSKCGSQSKSPKDLGMTSSTCGPNVESKPDSCKKSTSELEAPKVSKCGSKSESNRDLCKKSATTTKLATEGEPTKNICGSRLPSKTRKPTEELASKTSKSELSQDHCKKSLTMTKSASITQSPPDPCKKSSTDSKAKCGSQMKTPQETIKDSSTAESNKELCKRSSTPQRCETKLESKPDSCKKSTANDSKCQQNRGSFQKTPEMEAKEVAKYGSKSESNRDLCKKSATTTKLATEGEPTKNICGSRLPSKTRKPTEELASKTSKSKLSQDHCKKSLTMTKSASITQSPPDPCKKSSTDSKAKCGSQMKTPQETIKDSSTAESNKELCKRSSTPQRCETKLESKPDSCKKSTASDSKCQQNRGSFQKTPEMETESNRDLCKKSATTTKLATESEPTKNICGSRLPSKTRKITEELASKTSKSELSQDHCKKSLTMTKSASITQSPPDPCKKSSTDSKAKCGSQMKTPGEKVKDNSMSESNKEICKRSSTPQRCGAKFESKPDSCKKSTASDSKSQQKRGSLEKIPEMEAPKIAKCGSKSECNKDLCKKSATTTKFESECDQMKNPSETSSTLSSSATDSKVHLGSQEKTAEQKVAIAPKCGASSKSNTDVCRSSNPKSVTETKEQLESEAKAAEHKVATAPKCGGSFTEIKEQLGSQEKTAEQKVTPTQKCASLTHASQQACKRAAKAKCGFKVAGEGSKKSYPSSTSSSDPKNPLYPPKRKSHTLSITLKPYSGELENPTNFILSRYLSNEYPNKLYKETRDIAKARQYDFKNNSAEEALLGKLKKSISSPKTNCTADDPAELCGETAYYRIYAKRG